MSSRDLIGGSSSYYLYDANGNVSEVIDNAGTVQAHYEYDSFGNVIVSNGVLASENEFQFSTKYYDAETGLNYYGFRYYSPNLGRWINRDPIKENGGFNLYGFVDNNSIDYWDVLGQQKGRRGWRPPGRRNASFPTLNLDLDFTKGFSISGQAGSPVGVSWSGTISVTVGECCSFDEGIKDMYEISGTLTAGVGFGTTGWTIQNNIAATKVDFGFPECPTESRPTIDAIITIGGGAGVPGISVGGGCTWNITGGSASCSFGVSASGGTGGASVSIEGGIDVTGKFVPEE